MSYVCRAMSYVCRTMSYVCRTVSYVCRAMSYVCRTMSYVCRTMSYVCRTMSYVCRTVSMFILPWSGSACLLCNRFVLLPDPSVGKSMKWNGQAWRAHGGSEIRWKLIWRQVSIHHVCMMVALYLKSSFCRCHSCISWWYTSSGPERFPFKMNLFQPLLSKDCVLLGSLTRGCAGHGTEEVEVWMLGLRKWRCGCRLEC